MNGIDGKNRFKIPHVKQPCSNCPYRKDARKGWLGKERMSDFLAGDNFLCHKNHKLQCAGHMIIKGDRNVIVRAAAMLEMPITLEGQELVFETEAECIAHHGGSDKK